MTTTTINESTTLIDYITGPDRYAIVKDYGQINELTVFVSDDINKIATFIKTQSGEMNILTLEQIEAKKVAA
jgi:hypothetical protein